MAHAFFFERNFWAEKTAQLIEERVFSELRKNGTCSVALTGGRAASKVYEAWARSARFSEMNGVRFYLGDERCVPANHADSNSFLVEQTLFAKGLPNGATFEKVQFGFGLESAIAAYDSNLPDILDIVLLGLGHDGHVASIFPGGKAALEFNKKIVFVDHPGVFQKRITITPKLILAAKNIFVIPFNLEKIGILLMALKDSHNYVDLPARLALDGAWLFEH